MNAFKIFVLRTVVITYISIVRLIIPIFMAWALNTLWGVNYIIGFLVGALVGATLTSLYELKYGKVLWLNEKHMFEKIDMSI